jgi:hypothetical protein
MVIQGDLSTPESGCRVAAMDFKLLGAVSAVTPHAFALELASGDRIWLTRQAIFTVDHGLVTLVCNAARVRAYLAVAPEAPIAQHRMQSAPTRRAILGWTRGVPIGRPVRVGSWLHHLDTADVEASGSPRPR